ncbi:MAG TPA: M20 family peptidase [Thermoplasmatales archaeon]|nr:M20 family peptidase [Thermoplasmatales archaeon]
MEHRIDASEEDDLVALTKKLISIPSTAEHGREIYDFVQGYLRKRGLSPRLQTIKNPFDHTDRYSNLYAKLGTGRGPKVMLNGHLDTVPARGDWFYPPHQATEESGKIYGLGAADMKGGCAAAIAAVLALAQRRESIDGELFLSFVFGEESPFSLGADSLLREHDIHDYDLIVITEPSPILALGDYCYTHRRVHKSSFPVPIIGAEGRIMFEIEFYGKSSHASHPSHGVNALEDAAQLISKLVDFDVFSSIKMGRGHYVVLNIEGGDQTFTVPSYCKILVNRQLTLGEDEESAIREVKHIIDKLNLRSQVSIKKRFSPSPDLEYRPYLFERSPLLEKFMEVLPPANGERCRFTTSSVGDFNLFATRTGVPTLVFGPGGGNIHAPNEYVHRQEVVHTANYLLEFFMRIF